MKFTSINISNSEHSFKYIFEYNQNDHLNNDYTYVVSGDNIYINNKNTPIWIHDSNIWSNIDASTIPLSNIKTSNITLYFPDYSVETYVKGVSYAITLNIWIGNKSIYLGAYIANRSQALAADRIKQFYNQKYYESMEFEIPDPSDMVYGDTWRDWRKSVCGSQIINGVESNNDAPILNVTLYPVVKSGDIYVKYSDYNGGQNGIRFQEYNANLHYNLKVNYNKYPCMLFESNIQFNNVYKQNLRGFKDYLLETYDINGDDCVLRYDYYIQDKENVYGYYSKYVDNIKCELTKYDINNSEYPFSSWDEFIDGLYISGTLNIINKNNINDESGVLMTIMSNPIPITKELYKFIVKDDSNDVDFIKLNQIDMKVYEINTVNKVEQNIIQVERPKDYKSNLIKPVYYRTRELNHVIFHPAVTENVCINLDSYKSQASSFILKLEGVNFKETARVSNGVIFKIIGNTLPTTTSSGIYYILNENDELITTGKYTYEM